MIKSVFENYLHVLKRFKVASILNIFGLTAAFVGFILILIQLNYELGFDKYYPKWENIYRFTFHYSGVEKDGSGANTSTMFTRNMIDAIIESYPQIESGTLLAFYTSSDVYAQIDKGQERQGMKLPITICYPEITDVFGFEMIEGTLDCLKRPENILIPQSMAKRLFGKESAIGKTIYFKSDIWGKTGYGSETPLVVAGVYKDFPKNVQLENCIYTAIGEYYAKSKNDSSQNYVFYARLSKDADTKQMENFFTTHDNFILSPYWGETKLIANNISEIYYSKEGTFGYKTGDSNTSTLLILIAILVISVAAINFGNFSIAMAPRRIMGINIRKILGNSNSSLRIGLVFEAILLSFMSFVIALGILYLIIHNKLMPFIETDISQSNYLNIVLLAVGCALIVGLAAGIRPAFYMTSFAPSEALKGKVIYTSSGFKIRTLMVGFQFVVAIILVSATLFMYMQFHFMKNYNLGFDTDQVAIVELNTEMERNNKTEYIQKLKEHPAIADVAFSQNKLGARDSYPSYGGMRLNGSEEAYDYNLFPVSWNFLSLMNIQPLEGRLFTEEEAHSSETKLIISKRTQENTGAGIGDSFAYSWRSETPQYVVGIVDNVQFRSLRNTMGNMAFTLNDKNGHNVLPISYIKINAGAKVQDVVNHINKTIALIDPAYPVKIEFYDEIFDQLYQRENRLSKSITVFSFLAIIIAVMGVFGMVVFESESRRKEIAIRKVTGSNVSKILVLFNKDYIKILMVSLIIALPIIYYSINKWLQQFAFKISIQWWMLLAGGFVVLIIIISTVSIQGYRAAVTNPINSLRED